MTAKRRGGGRGGGERRMVPDAQPASYYGRPVIREPVWTWEIPIYFFVGGMAGASAPLSFAARLAGNDRLARSSAAVAFAGAAVSPVLLISDLGRPERFLNMLRMLKPTSPMSVGSWVLAGFGPVAALSAAREWLGIGGAAGRGAQAAAAFLGPWLSTYTAVLIANTAVPVWHEARSELPYLFAAGSLQSAGGAAVLLTAPHAARPARRVALAGAACELAAAALMERRLGARLATPYGDGRSGGFARAARALTASGVAALALSRPHRRRRPLAAAGASLLIAGAAVQRWAVFEAGVRSARDPAHTVGPQRAAQAARSAPQ